MAYQSVFKRYELKYLLTQAQKAKVLDAMASHMVQDAYGRSTIRNIYFDTASYRLIRHSIDKPVYKEKLRIRSYHRAEADTPVFVELKRKYNGVVYKRRLSMPEQQAMAWITGDGACPQDSQIGREIEYFLDFYQDLTPKVFLSYQREAYYAREDHTFRITFDDHICARLQDLSLESEPDGIALLPKDMVLMEVKCAGGIPLWLTQLLTQEKIYKTSFSKYGTAYQMLIFTKRKEEQTHAEPIVSRNL